MSLRSRLFLVVAAAITPFVLYAALTTTREKAVVGSSLRTRSMARAKTVARTLDDRLMTIDRLLDSAMTRVRRPNVRAGDALVADPGMALPNPGVSIAMIDTGGRRTGLMMGDAGRIDGIPVDRRISLVATAIGIARQRRGGASPTFVDEGTARDPSDSIAMIIVRALPRATVRCNCAADTPGALVAVMSDQTVQQLLGTDTTSGGGISVLIGSAGLPLGRIASPERWTDRAPRDTSLFGAAMDSGVIELKGLDGITRTVGVAALTRLPWRVYVGLPSAGLSAEPDQRLSDALMLAALALAIAAVGAVLASRAFIAPLKMLATDTRRLTAGALTHRTTVASRGGELGALGTALNSLAADFDTRRRALQDELRRAQQLIEESPVAMWITDAAADSPGVGRIQKANAAAGRLFGVEPGALIGQRDGELLEATDALLALPAAGETGSRRGRVHIAGQIARDRQYDVTVSYPDVPHTPIRVVTLQDATPRTVTAPMASESIGSADAHDAVVGFAGHVADEFNQLLHGIAGFTRLAADSVDDPDMTAIAIQRIRDLAHDGLAMAQQLQSFGRRNTLDRSVIDFNDTVTDVVQAMGGTFSTDVELEVLFNVSPSPVFADPALANYVVSVLIANAREAMPAGGTLTVATTYVDVPRISADAWIAPPGRYIVLTVADTGVGMTRDAQRHIFDPYYSTKVAPRRGLGLASVDGIAKEHGWFVGVESEVQVGTAFSLYMPIVPVPGESRPADIARPIAPPHAYAVRDRALPIVIEPVAHVDAETTQATDAEPHAASAPDDQASLETEPARSA